MTLIKSISGIRGTIGGSVENNLTPIDAVNFGCAYAKWLIKKKSISKNKVIIGRDARVSGKMIQNLVQSSLISMGIDVVDLGLSTTPTVEIMVKKYNADGGIIITASHNPKEWNALKLLNKNGEFLNKHEGESEDSFVQRLGEDLEDHIIKQDPETIAAMFAEPLMGAGGVIIPPKNYFETIQPILDKYEIPLIDDEVICGFGRTGNVWGAETFGMKPVSITVAKALSSSYLPISAVIISDDCYNIVAEKSGELGIFGHGYTYSGHPVACAVAVKTLEIYERENTFDHVNKVSPTFISRLKACDNFDLVGNTRGIGLIGAMEFVSEKNSNKGFEKKGIAGKIFADNAKDNGLIVRAIGDVIAFCPPLIINDSQINDMFDIVEDSLKKTMDELTKLGHLK